MIATNIRPKNYWSRKTATTTNHNAFGASKVHDYVEWRIALSEYTKTWRITHANPDHLFSAIAQNWAMQLFDGFVMQGHIWKYRYKALFASLLNQPYRHSVKWHVGREWGIIIESLVFVPQTHSSWMLNKSGACGPSTGHGNKLLVVTQFYHYFSILQHDHISQLSYTSAAGALVFQNVCN